VNKKTVLVCSAWPYASGVPHLGNLVSSLLSGDVFARYYRLRGHDVLYVSGSDAHGTKIEFEARRLGLAPGELARRNHETILGLLDAFGISFDNYTTTESAVHKQFVRDIYLAMEANGYIRTQDELRPYCQNCAKYLADRFIGGTCPRCGSPNALGDQCDACGAMLESDELVSPVCALCGRSEIEFRRTTHWYLDLERLSGPLREYVESRGFQGNVRLFTQQMIDEGLKPRAMTRDIEWGIAAPFAGAEGKVIYVWGEAALGYVSAVVEHFAGGGEWKRFWFGDDVHQVYALGKDNIAFHTLIFPGQLIASGRGYHLPDQIAATEYLNWIGGESFSKTRGVGLYCDDALALMDAELWRFYLLYNRPEGRDTNFSWEEVEKAVNGVLISNIANLMNRVLSFIQTRYGGAVPDADVDDEVLARLHRTVEDFERAVEGGLLGQGLRAVCDLAGFGNEYFQRKKPWETSDAAAVAGAFHLIKGLAVLLSPYLPRFTAAVLAVMGIERPVWGDLDAVHRGRPVGSDRVLLERIDVEALRQVGKAGEAKQEQRSECVAYADFARLDLRIGRIRTAAEVEGAKRLLRLTIDLGGELRGCVAGIRVSYRPEDLVDRLVLVVANLPPREIHGLRSECMLLAAQDGGIALLGPDRPVGPGTPVG